MQVASTKSGINWKKWLVYGATALVAVTVGYYSYKAWYTPQLAETATLDKGEIKTAEETYLEILKEAKLGDLTTTEEFDLLNGKWAAKVADKTSELHKVVKPAQPGFLGWGKKDAVIRLKTAKELGITLKEGQADISKPEFKLDRDQFKDFHRNSHGIKNMELSADDKTEAALARKQAKVDEVNNALFGTRNQALGVAAVSTAAVGTGGYFAYNKWCSKKDDKPVDQKPVHQYPVNPHVPHRRTNKTAGDRTNTKTDESKTQVEGSDDTKTNKAEKKSGMPGWAIFLIVFAIVAVIGAVVYFVFFTSKDEDEEFDNEL